MLGKNSLEHRSWTVLSLPKWPLIALASTELPTPSWHSLMILHWSSVSIMQGTYLSAKEIHGHTQIVKNLVIHWSKLNFWFGRTLGNITWSYMHVYNHESVNFIKLIKKIYSYLIQIDPCRNGTAFTCIHPIWRILSFSWSSVCPICGLWRMDRLCLTLVSTDNWWYGRISNDKLLNLLLADLNTFGGVVGLTSSTCSGPDILPPSASLLEGGESLSKFTTSTLEFWL